jgi:acyl dehydratase
MQKRYFEDMQAGDVVELGSRAVTQDEIIAFARQFDPQPFHVDQELARESFFGGLVASGWHTAAMYMRLLVDGLLNQTVSLGSPGIDELRWLKPVRPGDTLQARFTVLETTPSRSRPTMGIVRGRGEVLNQHGDVVMTMVSAGFFGRKAPAVKTASKGAGPS